MKKQQGFGTISILIIIAAIALVGFIGLRVYDASQSKSNGQVDKPSNQNGSTTGSQPADPYAGWKTYCDTTEKACFKYPADWTIDPSNQNGIVSVTFKNPTASVFGSYVNYDTRDGRESPYFTTDMQELSVANANYKVVGGFNSSTPSVAPEYRVVDSKFTVGLKIGQQATLVNTARFTFNNMNTGHLQLLPKTSGMTQDQAKAWFASDDAKTALLIAKSFHIE